MRKKGSPVSLQSDLLQVIAEVDRAHPQGGDVNPDFFDADYLPTFFTAKSGEERHFSKQAVSALRRFVHTVHSNDLGLKHTIREGDLQRLAFQCFADLHAAEEFRSALPEEVAPKMTAALRQAVSTASQTYTHYFAAWTLGAELETPLSVGPVTFHARDVWVASLADSAIEHLIGYEARQGAQLSPGEWRKAVQDSIYGKEPGATLGVFADALSDGLRTCPSVLEVRVDGCEQRYSREFGRIAARTALDALCLLSDDDSLHRVVSLHEEPRPPVVTGTILMDSLGRLLPNTIRNHPGWRGSPHAASLAIRDGSILLAACGKAITAMLDPGSHVAPKLALRWLTALGWFGDGCREPSDAVAVTKLATSLDILACSGGSAFEIHQMLAHLLKIPDQAIVTAWPEKTLKKLVADIYNSGRSKILHGAHTDPMRSFSVDRHHASALARRALRTAVLRWVRYEGPDDDTAFRSMDAGKNS